MGSSNAAAAALRPYWLAAGALAGGSTWTGPAQIGWLGGGPSSNGEPRHRDAGAGRLDGGNWPASCLAGWPRS